ncbi:RidA family protein [Nocardiopsis chromatogenes]|uniref:RidA family protein n=1 Tax=Nocardiopsis chromatogenes TaxID=280239 RepID=UPI00034A418B|nr:Rid family hydrolase [Nocardiopsis chromatogenes]
MATDIIAPEGLHDPTPFGYSHLATAKGQVVAVAGQYASNAEGGVDPVLAEDFDAQVGLALANLGTALTAAGLDHSHVIKLNTYIVGHSPERLETLARHIRGIWGDRVPPQTLLGVASLALPGMLFEIDALAVKD